MALTDQNVNITGWCMKVDDVTKFREALVTVGKEIDDFENFTQGKENVPTSEAYLLIEKIRRAVDSCKHDEQITSLPDEPGSLPADTTTTTSDESASTATVSVILQDD